jgi:protein-S-isoprenylcysteine O-methyltransferase Ste14
MDLAMGQTTLPPTMMPSTAKHPIENRIPPPFVTVLIGAGMWTTKFIELPMRTRQPLRLAVACTIVTLGIASLVAGFRAFRKSRTTIDPVQIDRASALVTHGIFRFTRNPMYVSFTLLLLGWAAYLAVPVALLGPVGFVLFTNRFQIVAEERTMQYKFGEEYAEYRHKVRRWI